MKTKDADILLIPGYTNAGPDHWMSRWENKITSARRVVQDEWHKPVREEWVSRLLETIDGAERPVVLVAHSLGCSTSVLGAQEFTDEQKAKVRGAFLVAPPDVENPAIRPKHLLTFGPYPRERLPFPSIVVASRNDPFCPYPSAEAMAEAWGSLLLDAGESGHIRSDSGHGPWPEGTMVFSKFLNGLEA